MSAKELPKETIDERRENEPSSDVLPPEGSAMGREIKIGLGVILVLLAVFGGVLYYRLSGPPADTTTASQSKEGTADQPIKAGALADKSAAPAVVTAAAGSEASRARPSVADLAQWNDVSDHRTGTGQSVEAPAASSPPSYMPRAVAGADPFQKNTTQPASAQSPDTAVQAMPPSSATESADRSVPSGVVGVAQAGSGEVVTAQPNPLRDSSAATAPVLSSAPGEASTADAYRLTAANSSAQVAAAPAPVRSPTTLAQPLSASDSRPRTTFRSPSEPEAPVGTYSSQAARANITEVSTGSAPQQTPPVEGKYVIQPNENYWAISEKVYGTGAYFQALAEHNRKKFADESRLRVGEEIATPSIAELEKSHPSLCPKPGHRDATKRHMSVVSTPARLGAGRTYVVQEGDTLFDIARFELGKAARWAEIYDLNRDLLGNDFDHLTPGMQLALPQDRPSGTLTQRPDGVYQR